MNAVEIEEAVCKLAETPFDKENFPFSFLEAFGNKPTTIKRLKQGSSNQTDLDGAVLQRNNLHIKVCQEGDVGATLDELRESQATARQKVKYIIATDGQVLEAENLVDGETVVCEDLRDLPDHFGFFLGLAGISTVKEIRDNAFDIQATGRLNKLYIELLKVNPDWEKAENKEHLNQFMARLIFCFFAEDTNIFSESNLFTDTIEKMSASDSSNTHEVISEMFRSMCTPIEDRMTNGIKNWAKNFPYVNGGLFSGGLDVPKFSKIARSYLLHVGKLDWTKINPDIFGSMIQAVADDSERGALGMHYTSVPNILKVLNPLFLDDLKEQLVTAGDNGRKLLNLRKRISQIRVFDPACGSGNFLVIAYKEMRKLEAEINRRRDEVTRPTDIQLINFRGIELRHFSAEIARLALTIAEYQCDVIYRGLQLALESFLPLKDDNWITCGNALRVDWKEVCSVTISTENRENDTFSTSFDGQEGERKQKDPVTYICGNPPYLGSTWQSKEQKDDLKLVFGDKTKSWKSLDYVSGWFMKAADYMTKTNSTSAFVTTNSICQGQQVPILWPIIFDLNQEISFAHTSFKWANLASHNAGVTVAIIGMSKSSNGEKSIYSIDNSNKILVKRVSNINAYLVGSSNTIINKSQQSISNLPEMVRGNMPVDGGNLLLSPEDKRALNLTEQQEEMYVRNIYGSAEFIRGLTRYCLWIEDKYLEECLKIESIQKRIEAVKAMRLKSRDKGANSLANRPHQMREMNIGKDQTIILSRVSSENRKYLPVGLINNRATVTDLCYAIFEAPLWSLALVASRLHLIWIATVCGKLKTDFRYSNTMGWNTFPVPTLTEQNKVDLTKSATDILLARETHFPATIADLYSQEKMPENLEEAHKRNDEVLERIYIGRRFKNDSERLEKLFDLYSKIVSKQIT